MPKRRRWIRPIERPPLRTGTEMMLLAEAARWSGKPTIRIHPETVWSFGLGDGERFQGFTEMKRQVG